MVFVYTMKLGKHLATEFPELSDMPLLGYMLCMDQVNLRKLNKKIIRVHM